jgi:hypothetical protein
MHKKPSLSLTVVACLLAQAFPVAAQNGQETTESTTGPLRRAIAREALQLATAGERTRPDVGAGRQAVASDQPDWSRYATFASGRIATARSHEAVRFGHLAATTATSQAQPGKRPGWFKRHAILGCTLIGAAVGTAWGVVATSNPPAAKPGEPLPPGSSTNAVAIPLMGIIGGGVGALVGIAIELLR